MGTFSGPLTVYKRCHMKAQCATSCGVTRMTEEAGESLPGVQATLLARLSWEPSICPCLNFLLIRTYQKPSTTQTDSLWSQGTYQIGSNLTLKLGSDLLVQGASTGDGGVQLVPWQKCGHHLLCSQLLLPMWKSGNLMIMGGSNLYCVLCRLPSWSSTTPWSIPSSSLIRPPGAFSPSFIIYKKVFYRCFSFRRGEPHVTRRTPDYFL